MSVYHVTSGQTISNHTVRAGVTAEVAAGGELYRAFVLFDGTDIVSAGGLANGTVLAGSAVEEVFGSAISTHFQVSATVGATGEQIVEQGGVAIGTSVGYGAAQDVYGRTLSSIVGGPGGGNETVFQGGVASASLVVAGGTLTAGSGAVIDGARALRAGALVSASGGIASGVILSAGGELVLQAGGVGTGTQVENGGTVVVVQGAVLRDAVVFNSGLEQLVSGGSAVGTTVRLGAQEFVSSGGFASATHLTDGGGEEVLGGGLARGTVIFASGFQFIQGNSLVHGSAVGDIVSSGGSVTVFADGVVSDALLRTGGVMHDSGLALGTVLSGGTLEVSLPLAGSGVASGGTVDAGLLAVSSGAESINVLVQGASALERATFGGLVSGARVVQGGSLSVLGAATLEGATLGSATIGLAAGASASGIVFSGTGGTLVLGGATDTAGALSGVAAGDTVDLDGLFWAKGAAATFLSGNVLAVSAGGQVFDLALDPTQSISGLGTSVGADANGGTAVAFIHSVVGGGAMLAAELGSSLPLIAHS